MGRGVRVVGNNYTSDLNITVSSGMFGKTIECVHDVFGGEETVVGTLTITKPGKENLMHAFYNNYANKINACMPAWLYGSRSFSTTQYADYKSS